MAGSFSLPRPKNWQQFQLLARDLLQRYYGLTLEELGRQGQKQYGTDLFGKIPAKDKWNEELKLLELEDNAEGKLLFVQCKLRESLAFADILADHGKTKGIKGQEVAAIVYVTSMKRDTNLQLAIEKRADEIPLVRTVLYWDNFEQMLEQYDDIAARYGILPAVSERVKSEITMAVVDGLEPFNELLEEAKDGRAALREEQSQLDDKISKSLIKPVPIAEAIGTDELRSLLSRYTERAIPDSPLDLLSESRRERKFFLRYTYDDFFDSLIKACDISIDESPEVDEIGLKAVQLRAYGILTSAYLRRENKDDLGKIKLTLEMDPKKLWYRSGAKDKRKKILIEDRRINRFIDWATEYSDYVEGPYDREIIGLDVDTMTFDDLYKFMRERFDHAVTGMKRLIMLTRLQIKMARRKAKATEKDPALFWAIALQLTFSSLNDIMRAKL